MQQPAEPDDFLVFPAVMNPVGQTDEIDSEEVIQPDGGAGKAGVSVRTRKSQLASCVGIGIRSGDPVRFQRPAKAAVLSQCIGIISGHGCNGSFGQYPPVPDFAAAQQQDSVFADIRCMGEQSGVSGNSAQKPGIFIMDKSVYDDTGCLRPRLPGHVP